MSVPPQIESDERLGRRLSSRKHRNLVRRGNAPVSLFMREDTRILSVDRLRDDWLTDATNVAVRYDEGRGRTFYGWATVSEERANQSDRVVEPSPQEDNPYHADLVLPMIVMFNRRTYEKHAVELAAHASWQPLAADE